MSSLSTVDKIFVQATTDASCFEGLRIGWDMPKQTLHLGMISELSFLRMQGQIHFRQIQGMVGDDDTDANAKNDLISMGSSIQMESPTSGHQYQSHKGCSQKCRIHLWLLTYAKQIHSQMRSLPTQSPQFWWS